MGCRTIPRHLFTGNFWFRTLRLESQNPSSSIMVISRMGSKQFLQKILKYSNYCPNRVSAVFEPATHGSNFYTYSHSGQLVLSSGNSASPSLSPTRSGPRIRNERAFCTTNLLSTKINFKFTDATIDQQWIESPAFAKNFYLG